jgi:hypothetical protein
MESSFSFSSTSFLFKPWAGQVKQQYLRLFKLGRYHNIGAWSWCNVARDSGAVFSLLPLNRLLCCQLALSRRLKPSDCHESVVRYCRGSVVQ